MRVIAFDIGGSSIKSALIDASSAQAEIIERYDVIDLQTRHFKEVKAAVFRALDVSAVASGAAVVGISTTGTVDSSGVVLNAGHFDGYTNIDWRKLISAKWPSIHSVSTVNDGRASTWAEYLVRQRDCKYFAHLVVGTGVGGASVAAGHLVLGDNDHAGHFGHLKVTAEETIRCSCGGYGCVETLAGARGVVADYLRRKRDPLWATNASVQFSDIIDAARRRDRYALEALTRAGEWLGTGISFLTNIFNPRYVTLGGGVVVAGDRLKEELGVDPFFDAAVSTAKALAHKRAVENTSISKATHGNDGGLFGAAALASREAMHAPSSQ